MVISLEVHFSTRFQRVKHWLKVSEHIFEMLAIGNTISIIMLVLWLPISLSFSLVVKVLFEHFLLSVQNYLVKGIYPKCYSTVHTSTLHSV